MNEKEFQEVGLQLVEAAKKQLLMEFKFLTQTINVKETDFQTLMNLNLGRIKWLQDWGAKLEQADYELCAGIGISKQVATTLNNALQWTSYFEFETEKQEEDFKDKLKV